MEHNASFAATIGFFDGVHKGHQFLINRLNEMAHRIGQQSMVITFDRHPRQVVHADYVPQLITPLNEKLRLLNRSLGIMVMLVAVCGLVYGILGLR